MRWDNERQLANNTAWHIREFRRWAYRTHKGIKEYHDNNYIHNQISSEMGRIHGVLEAMSYLGAEEMERRLNRVWRHFFEQWIEANQTEVLGAAI